ncbi:MAG: hypothetical protein FJ395_15835 [Verrucomicrobia bacterium]|nr:hypothetical protein [Verrucomicrobiota bacterium]
MSKPGQVSNDSLVEIHKARNPWQGHLLIGYLQDNGVEAAFQGLPSVPLTAGELLETSNHVAGIYVLQQDAARGRELVEEFLAVEEVETTSPESQPLDKERIAELRGALREERKTFAFLGWVAVVFLVALAVLWAVWPVWLKTAPLAPLYRWTGVALLALAAAFALNQTRR